MRVSSKETVIGRDAPSDMIFVLLAAPCIPGQQWWLVGGASHTHWRHPSYPVNTTVCVVAETPSSTSQPCSKRSKVDEIGRGFVARKQCSESAMESRKLRKIRCFCICPLSVGSTSPLSVRRYSVGRCLIALLCQALLVSPRQSLNFPLPP